MITRIPRQLFGISHLNYTLNSSKFLETDDLDDYN